MARLAPDPHLAIDRLARLRARIDDLRAEAEAAEAAILALPDGPHSGFAARIRIAPGPSGDRTGTVTGALPPPPPDAAALPVQPNATGDLPAQSW
jgi:hypothetical protein